VDSTVDDSPTREIQTYQEPPTVHIEPSPSPGGNGRGWLKFGAAVLGVLALAALTIVVWPGARSVVRQSFTQQPDTFTELYFADAPSVNAGTVTAHVTLVRHGDGDADQAVEASLATASANGLMASRQRATLRPDQPETLTFILTIPARTTVTAVDVDVVNSPDNLHFRLPTSPGRTP
jgi:hypothetical protein